MRYLGTEADDAVAIVEQVDVSAARGTKQKAEGFAPLELARAVPQEWSSQGLPIPMLVGAIWRTYHCRRGERR